MNTLSKLARELESCIVDETGLCTVDDYRIVINFNMPHYEINGSYNAVGERNIVNNGTNSGYIAGNYTAADADSLNVFSLSDQQKILLEAYERLDVIGQARLITYASKLSKRGGEVA